MSNQRVTALPAVTGFRVLSPYTRAREAHIPENRVTGGNAVTPPESVPGRSAGTVSRPPRSNVTILRFCRCRDCRRFFRDDWGQQVCERGIGGTKITWGSGTRRCDPPPDAWHYCAGYSGPAISKDIWVWTYTHGGENHAEQ